MTDFKKLAFNQREEFISTLNHDLKIPIIAQIRALELLSKESLGTLNSEQKEILTLTLNSCKSIYKMISSILASYRYENKDIILDYEKMDISEVIERCIIRVSNLLSAKHIQFHIKSNNKNNLIFADKYQIQKAFGYIVDYCVNNTISDIVCYINNDKHQYISATLIFENPYSSQEKLNNIFSSRLDKVGSSLGLYLAKKIIDAHNGELNLKNYGFNNICTIKLPNTCNPNKTCDKIFL